MSFIELLLPAGSPEKMNYAFSYGADAVYAGAPIFSLRARDNEFTLPELEAGIKHARSINKKFYLTANIFSRNTKIESFKRALINWAEAKPDALIMSDPGLMLMAREIAPEIPIHLSVQANCMNWKSVKFWQQQGVSRIILSRELRLEEIKEIKQRVPDIELEAFVHGAICIAYSGRCLLSSYMSHRDANQGVCDNSCRYNYHLYKSDDYFIEDLRNKGEFYQIDEDEHGTYIMNAKDLCLIEHVKEIADAGVCSFKVEGRTKTLYYVAMVSRLYRKALDDMYTGKKFDPNLMGELEKIGNRGYHKGFMFPQPGASMQNYTEGSATQASRVFAGAYLGEGQFKGFSHIDVKAKIKKGDSLEVIEPYKEQVSKVSVLEILNKDGESIEVAHGGKGPFYLNLNYQPPPYSLLRLC